MARPYIIKSQYNVITIRDAEGTSNIAAWVDGHYNATWVAGPDISTVFRRLGFQVALLEDDGEQSGPLHDASGSLTKDMQLHLEGLASTTSPHHPPQESKNQPESGLEPEPSPCNKQRILNGERVKVACPRCGAGPCALGITLQFDATRQRMFDASVVKRVRRGRAAPDQRDCP